MSITVRSLQVADCERVAELTHQLVENIVQPELLVARLKLLAEETGPWHWLVAEQDGRVVAAGGLVWHVSPSKGRIAFIEELVVENFNLEFAPQLALELKAMAEKLEVSRLKVAIKFYPELLKFYESLGFTSSKEGSFIHSICM